MGGGDGGRGFGVKGVFLRVQQHRAAGADKDVQHWSCEQEKRDIAGSPVTEESHIPMYEN